MTASHSPSHESTGVLIHHAGRYDLLVKLFTFGRESALRGKILALVRLKPGESALDIGCGTGTLAIMAKRLIGPGGEMHGVDAAPEMLERAIKKAKRVGVGVTFTQGTVQALPYDDGTFDAVLSTFMLHHVPENARSAMVGEIRRVLKPGGRVLAVDFAAGSSGGNRGLVHRHGTIAFVDIVKELEAAGFTIARQGAVGERNLQYVLAGPVDLAPTLGEVAAVPRHFGRMAHVGLAAIAGLAILLHLGAFGAVAALSPWSMSWGLLGLVIVLVLLKIGVLGVMHHVLGSRFGAWLGGGTHGTRNASIPPK